MSLIDENLRYRLMKILIQAMKTWSIGVLLIIQLCSCKNKLQEEFNWIPTAGAAEEYPIKIIRGRFISNEGHSANLPSQEFIDAGWGNSGGVMVVGPERKPVPDSLEVLWLSYVDNKFYGCKSNLETYLAFISEDHKSISTSIYLGRIFY